MRFVIMRKADPNTEAGMMPSEELIVAMGKYHEEMIEAGVLRGGDGLKPSAAGARVSFSRGKPTVTDGPFTETKELIAGFTIIDVASRDEAIAWMKRWPTIDGDGGVQLELRPLYEMSDFGEGEAIEQHVRQREQLARS